MNFVVSLDALPVAALFTAHRAATFRFRPGREGYAGERLPPCLVPCVTIGTQPLPCHMPNGAFLETISMARAAGHVPRRMQGKIERDPEQLSDRIEQEGHRHGQGDSRELHL